MSFLRFFVFILKTVLFSGEEQQPPIHNGVPSDQFVPGAAPGHHMSHSMPVAQHSMQSTQHSVPHSVVQSFYPDQPHEAPGAPVSLRENQTSRSKTAGVRCKMVQM